MNCEAVLSGRSSRLSVQPEGFGFENDWLASQSRSYRRMTTRDGSPRKPRKGLRVEAFLLPFAFLTNRTALFEFRNALSSPFCDHTTMLLAISIQLNWKVVEVARLAGCREGLDMIAVHFRFRFVCFAARLQSRGTSLVFHLAAALEPKLFTSWRKGKSEIERNLEKHRRVSNPKPAQGPTHGPGESLFGQQLDTQWIEE